MPYSSTSTGQRTFVGNDSLYAAAVCGSAMFAGADAALVRPADTTATVVGGAIGSASSAVFKFSGFFEGDAAHGLLTGMRLIVSGPAGITVPAGIAIRAHLFTADVAATVLSANADKGAFRTMAAAMGASLGHVDFTDFVGGGTGADAFYAFGKPAVSPLHVKAADGADDLYAILVATAVFTPISGAVHALSASRAGL
jgi:hypothetical protein